MGTHLWSQITQPQSLKVRTFMITLYNTTVTTLHDRLQQTARDYVSVKSASLHSPATTQITPSSVMACLPLHEDDWFVDAS
jgi:hypothetical protein